MLKLIYGLVGGTALLMLGIDMMGDGLEKAAGDMLRKILKKLTSNLFMATAVGTVLTAIVQSSTAITIMMVGFVNAGLMDLTQALGIIYGANIGTTMTIQLMRLSLTDHALLILGVGMFLQMVTKNERLKHLSNAILGFGLIFLGLQMLSSGSGYVKENPAMRDFFIHYGSNPILGILIGAIFTALVHSSAAATGLVIALARVGLLDIYGAAAITLGNNVGTCISAQIASLGSSVAARRTAWGHTLFNVIGVGLCIPIFRPFVTMVTWTASDITSQVANLHTIQNIASVLLFIPFTPTFVKLLTRMNPDRRAVSQHGALHLDKLLLDTPDLAVRASQEELKRTLEVTAGMYHHIHSALVKEDRSLLEQVASDEEIVNSLHSDLTEYLVELTRHSLDQQQSQRVSSLLYAVGDVERIGDHAFAMSEHVEKKIDGKLPFSEKAFSDLKIVVERLDNLHEITQQCLVEPDGILGDQAEEIRDSIYELAEEARSGHIERLKDGRCSVESGIVYLDVISYFERISDHLLNIIRVTLDRRRSHGNVLRA